MFRILYHSYIEFMSNILVMFFFHTALRKQARKLENDIDMKLVAYTKVDSSSSASMSIDTAPLLGDHVFDSLSLEIEQLLERVSGTDEYEFIGLYAQVKMIN